MRLFTALALPPHVTGVLRDAVQRGRRHEPGLRWSAPEHWHLTLVFLGDTDPQRLPALEAAIERAAAAHPPLDLALDGWGTFPGRSERASVLWAGVGGATHGASALVEDLHAAARGAGCRTQDRPYVPHITIARSRPPRDLGGIAAVLGDLPRRRWRATRVDLVQSTPGRGTRYRTVFTAPLGPVSSGCPVA